MRNDIVKRGRARSARINHSRKGTSKASFRRPESLTQQRFLPVVEINRGPKKAGTFEDVIDRLRNAGAVRRELKGN